MQSREQTLFFLARSISLYIMCARASSGGQHPSVTTKVKHLRVCFIRSNRIQYMLFPSSQSRTTSAIVKEEEEENVNMNSQDKKKMSR
jgi:hypothetical protein